MKNSLKTVFGFLALVVLGVAAQEEANCGAAVDCNTCTGNCRVCVADKLATCSAKAECSEVEFGGLDFKHNTCEESNGVKLNFLSDVKTPEACEESANKWCVDEAKTNGGCFKSIETCTDVGMFEPETNEVDPAHNTTTTSSMTTKYSKETETEGEATESTSSAVPLSSAFGSLFASVFVYYIVVA